MKLTFDGGLNLSEQTKIQDNELGIAKNCDFRKKNIVRSRDGRKLVYSGLGNNVDWIIRGDNYLYAVVDDNLYIDGIDLGEDIENIQDFEKMQEYNLDTQAIFLAGAMKKIYYDGTTHHVYQWGITPPDRAMTLSVGTGTGLTGTYYFRYTYCRKVGGVLVHESNPSPISGPVVVADQDIDFTMPASIPTDPQITHIRIYRTLADADSSEAYYYDQEIGNDTLTGTSLKADTALGSTLEYDNDVPPNCTTVAGPGTYKVLFLAVGNKLYFTKTLRPDSVPSTYYLIIGIPQYPIKRIIIWNGLAFAFTKIAIYSIQGTTPATFIAYHTPASHGLEASKAIVATEKGIFYLSYDGIYLFNGMYEKKVTDPKLTSLFTGRIENNIMPISKDYIEKCWMQYYNSKLFFGYPEQGQTVINKVLVCDIQEGKWSIYDYSKILLCSEFDTQESRLLAGDNSGNIWELENGEVDHTDSIDFHIRSKILNEYKYIPLTWIKYDIVNSNGNTLYGRLLEDGTIVNTHTITDEKNTRRRYLASKAIKRASIEIQGNITSRVEINGVSIDES
jgi:hypothetical protein